MDENIKAADVTIETSDALVDAPAEDTAKSWVGFPEESPRYIHKTIFYPAVELGVWNWDKKLGLRVRILQVVSYVLSQDVLLFSHHRPLSDARKEGFTQLNAVLDLVKDTENGIDA